MSAQEDATTFALSQLASRLERRLPGLLDEWVDGIEAAAPRPVSFVQPPREEALAEALLLARRVRVATLGTKRRRKKHPR